VISVRVRDVQTQVLHNQRADEAVDLSDHSMDDHSEMSASGSHDFPDEPRQQSRSQHSDQDSPVEMTAQRGGRSDSGRGSGRGGGGSAGAQRDAVCLFGFIFVFR
jgi:hypothetical protein